MKCLNLQIKIKKKSNIEYKQIFDDITNEEIATTIFCYNIYAMIAGVGGPLWEKILGIVV